MSEKPTPEMNLRMAWAVIQLGMPQHAVASLFNVNAGRVAEAVKAVRIAIASPTALIELKETTDALPAIGQAMLDGNFSMSEYLHSEGTEYLRRKGLTS